MIESGTQVKWVSQAQGSHVEKTGKVLAYIPRRVNADLIAEGIGFKTKPKLQGQKYSSVPRYLVEVTSGKGSVKYYTPLASTIEKQNPEALA